MADKESTTPPDAAAAPPSSPLTPAAKRVRTTSPPRTAGEQQTSTTEASPASAAVSSEELPLDVDVEADDDASDSGWGTDKNSETTSITSSIYAGYVENGRRYQSTREGEYWGPSDEKQFESMQGAHLMHLIMDSQAENPLFRAPVPDTVQNILDVGTGNGAWAQAVADKFPSAVVQGVDLYPPPETWVPPNCVFTVEDVLKPWVWQQKFDLIHLRWLCGAFTPRQWDNLYTQTYKHLTPGGWIEQLEPAITFFSDDGTLPSDSLLPKWGPMFLDCCERAGKPIDTSDTMKAKIASHGFANVQEKVYKVPLGDWARHPILKEAGRVNKEQIMQGLEGYSMYLLTKFGLPEPWGAEEVQVFLANVRKELNNGWHIYLVMKRVWAQKPLDT